MEDGDAGLGIRTKYSWYLVVRGFVFGERFIDSDIFRGDVKVP